MEINPSVSVEPIIGLRPQALSIIRKNAENGILPRM